MENPPSSPPSRVHETRRARGEATPSRCSVHGVYGDDGPGGGWQIERDGANKAWRDKGESQGPGEGRGRRETGVEKFNCAYFRSDVSQILRHRTLSLSLFLLSLFFWPRSQTEENWNDTSAPLLSLPLSDIFNFFLSPSPFALLYLFPRQKSFFSLSLFSLSLSLYVELNAYLFLLFRNSFFIEETKRKRRNLSSPRDRLSGARFHVFSFSTSFGNAGTLSFSFPPVNQFLLPPPPPTAVLLGFILSFLPASIFIVITNLIKSRVSTSYALGGCVKHFN